MGIAQTSDALGVADTMPKFPGGNKGLGIFIQKNLNYPPMEREKNHMGKSIVQFVVDTSGLVSEAKIIKSSGYEALDNEAIRVINLMPKWEPGYDKGNKAKVLMNLPVVFKTLGTVRNKEEMKREEYLADLKLGDKEFKSKNYSEAIKYYNSAINRHENNEDAILGKANSLFLLERKSEGCELIKDLVDKKNYKAEKLEKKYCK